MKTILGLAVTAVGLAGALPAAAQCPAGGMAVDVTEPVPIVMKYTWKLAGVKPNALKSALEKLPTVVKASFDDKNPNQIVLKYKGSCDKLAQLESAAREAGVPAFVLNHAHVTIVLKTQPGADVKGAIEALGKVQGAVYAKVSGTAGLELHGDLSLLSIDEMRDVAAPFKCTPVVNQSYEYVRFKVSEGKPGDFRLAAGALKGVVVARDEGDNVVGLWINKSATRIEPIEKLEGFKVKRV